MHKVTMINAYGERSENEFETIKEAAYVRGPSMPVIFDGKAGHFETRPAPLEEVAFVETCEDFQQFRYTHLPAHLQEVSKRFYDVAEFMFFQLPDCRQREVAMLDLLRSKDAAVRARLTR